MSARPAKKSPLPATSKLPLDSVATKYETCGWKVIRVAGINDLIAERDGKLHFVQIVTPETIENAKFKDIAKGTFIQNSFSNGAIPVFAHVVAKRNSNLITFENVNTAGRIIIKPKTTITPAPTPAPAPASIILKNDS